MLLATTTHSLLYQEDDPMLLTFRSALVAACLTLAALPFAHADTISLSGSIIGDAGVGDTNALVTFTATFSTQQLEDCIANSTCIGGSPNEYFVDISTGATFTVGVAGVFAPINANGNDFVDFFASPDFTSFDVVAIGDSAGRLVIDAETEETLGANCYENLLPEYCPVSAGPLGLTSAIDSSFTSSFSISTAPEPSTLALFGTGILGLVGTMRRKVY
jgi:PEP-CTERM motif